VYITLRDVKLKFRTITFVTIYLQTLLVKNLWECFLPIFIQNLFPVR